MFQLQAHLFAKDPHRQHAGLVPTLERRHRQEPSSLEQRGSWTLARAPDGTGPIVPVAAWLYDQGVDRLVVWRALASGRVRYLLARRSDLVAGFPLPRFYDALNRAEAEARGVGLGPGDLWGGGSSVGGSPRQGGSVMEPAAVADILERVMGARYGG